MKVVYKEVLVPYFKDGDFEYELSNLIEIVDDLIDTDGFFKCCLLYSKRLEVYLVDKKLISQNARGGYYSIDDKGLQSFLERLYDLQ